MSQKELDFGRLYRLDAEFKSAYKATEEAIDAVGLIVAAGASGMESPDLSKTFTPNSGRHLRLRTAMGVGAVATADYRRAIVQPIARLFGFEIQVAKTKTPEERERERRDWMSKHSPALLELMDRELGQ